jgi:transcriptional regulator with XRE-family HTH domain
VGKANRPRPKRLAEKLLTIRQKLDGGLSQNEMLRKLGLENDLERDRISKYERNTLDPPWYVLLRYAETANIYLEALIKDELDLPEKLPSKKKSEGILNTKLES